MKARLKGLDKVLKKQYLDFRRGAHDDVFFPQGEGLARFLSRRANEPSVYYAITEL